MVLMSGLQVFLDEGDLVRDEPVLGVGDVDHAEVLGGGQDVVVGVAEHPGDLPHTLGQRRGCDLDRGDGGLGGHDGLGFFDPGVDDLGVAVIVDAARDVVEAVVRDEIGDVVDELGTDVETLLEDGVLGGQLRDASITDGGEGGVELLVLFPGVGDAGELGFQLVLAHEGGPLSWDGWVSSFATCSGLGITWRS